MEVKPGDRIMVDSFKVGQLRRSGTVLEVLQSRGGLRLKVRWEDGHETIFTPSAGNVRVLPQEPARS
jgi:hypothetical protein